MNYRRLACSLFVLLNSWSLQANNLFLFSSTDSPSIANAYTATALGFSFQTSFSTPPRSAFALAHPTGTKYYIVAKSGSDSVWVVDGATFSNVGRPRFTFGQSPEAAVIMPDGRRVLVAAGGLKMIDTATDTEVLANPDVGTQPIDVAVSLDSTRAFVLSSVSQRLTAVDLQTNTVVGSLNVPGTSTGVSVAPNGLVYVSATNQVMEIDGRTMTSRGAFPLNGLPGKTYFTADGRLGVAVNRSLITQLAMFVLDLQSAARSVTSLPSFGVQFDQIVIAGNNRAFAVGNNRLYDISLSPLNVGEATLSGIGALTGVLGAATSTEVPIPRYLYLSTSTSAYRVDLGTVNLSNSQAVFTGGIPGALAFASPVATGPPVSVLSYNNNQNIPLAGTFLPVIVRALDATGRPLSGVGVTFTTTGGSISSSSTTTNNEGFAQATINAPTTASTFTVTATLAGGTSTTFTLTVSTSGGTPGSGGISIFSGNGQVLREQTLINFPLVVAIRDSNGVPLPGQPVTFTLTSGQGTLNPSTFQGTSTSTFCSGNVCTSTTDTAGKAQAGFLATSIPVGLSYSPSTITATSTGGSVNFYVTTVLNLLPGGALAAPPLVELIKPTEQRTISGGAGQTIAEAIQIRVVASSGGQSGQAIPNIGLTVGTGLDPAAGPTAACNTAGGTALTDGIGIATCNLALGGKLGTAPLNVDVGGFVTFPSLQVQVSPGPPSILQIVQGNNQSGNPGDRLPLAMVLRITDAFNNPLGGTQATFTVVTPGTITLENVISTADVDGRVSALGRLGSIPGQHQVQVTAGGITQTINFTVNILATGLAKVSGDGQSAVINQPFAAPLIVAVTNAQGQPVQGATVNFTIASGTATLGTPNAPTDAAGRAQTTVTAGGTVGTVNINATVAGTTLAQTFSLTARPVAPAFTAANVFNTASGQLGVSPGSLATIAATGIGQGITGTLVGDTVAGGAWPYQLNGVEVAFDGNPAPIHSVSNMNGQEWMIVQVPWALAAPATVSVTVAKGGSTTVGGIQVMRVQPGIFETSSGGQTYAVLLRPNGSYVTPQTPALRGEVLCMFATGLGFVLPASDTNRSGIPGQQVMAPVIVGVNNEGVRVVSASLAPNLIGVYVVYFEVPQNAFAGAQRPLALAVQDPSGNPIFGNGSAIAALQ